MPATVNKQKQQKQDEMAPLNGDETVEESVESNFTESSPPSNLPNNGKQTTTVKSSDGKLHRISLETNYIEITLLNAKSQPTRHANKIPLNFVLSVRSSRAKLRCGLPRQNVQPENDATEAGNRGNNKRLPNVLYLYYTYRWNVYAWRLRECEIHFHSTTEKKQWEILLRSAIANQPLRPKRLLVFINPFGGKGKANEIWSKEVEPFFNLANIEVEVVKTERADHALETVRELDADKWHTLDGIVSVGGDGLFNEVLSAAITRTQDEHGINYNNAEVSALVTPRMRLGIIGAGSANSIVSSVHGINDCPTAAIHIAIGNECKVDVCAVYENGLLSRFSADAISYGWLGDVLHDSERYRCLGPIRYQFSALRTSIRHPTYFGRVSFALSPTQPPLSASIDESGSGPSSPRNIPPCTGPCDICSGKVPPEEAFPYHWQTDFTHVICCVIPCVSPFTPYGLAPYTGLCDGTMDLALIPKVSRCTNLQIMLKVAMSGARFIRSEYPDVKVYRVSRWKFTPKAMVLAPPTEGQEVPSPDESGAWNLDGEILPQPPDRPLHFRLHPSLIRYFGRSDPLDLDHPEYSSCCLCCKCEKKVSNLVYKMPN